MQNGLPPLLQDELQQLIQNEVEAELFNISQSVRKRVGDKVVGVMTRLHLTLYRRYRQSLEGGSSDVREGRSPLPEEVEGGSSSLMLPEEALTEEAMMDILQDATRDTIQDIDWSTYIQDMGLDG